MRRMVVVVVPILLWGCASDDEELTVRRLVICDAAGRARIELLGDTKEGPTFRVLDEGGHTRLSIVHSDKGDGTIVVELRSGDGDGAAIELLQTKNTAIASLYGEGHRRRVFIGASDADALLSLNAGPAGNTRIELECAENRCAVSVSDIENVTTVHTASMAVDGEKGARLRVQRGPEILWESQR